MPTFVGLDLAWTPTHETGVCVIRCDRGEARLVALDTRIDTPEGFAALCLSGGDDVVAAIDAPLVVGPQRRADSELAAQFSKFKAGAYSATLPFLTKMNGLAGPTLARLLQDANFELDPTRLSRGARGRFALEVFPHPAHVALFGLNMRLRYKKGTLASRRLALLDYQRHLAQLLSRELPHLLWSELMQQVLEPAAVDCTGRAMKQLEDKLDAVTCAYVAYHCWAHGQAGFRAFGCAEHGCIIVPRATLAATCVRGRTSP